jgi:hypothetical protein
MGDENIMRHHNPPGSNKILVTHLDAGVMLFNFVGDVIIDNYIFDLEVSNRIGGLVSSNLDISYETFYKHEKRPMKVSFKVGAKRLELPTLPSPSGDFNVTVGAKRLELPTSSM